MYIYLESETTPGLFTVGFYSPDGKFHPDSDHDSRDKAGNRVAFLNGSPKPLPHLDPFY